jgi:hypothetical protein
VRGVEQAPPPKKNTIAVIIPLAAGETLWRRAANDIIQAAANAPFGLELIFAAPDDGDDTPPPADLPPDSRWLVCPKPGRAAQMNFAAAQSNKADYLWFVHADTRIGGDAIAALAAAFASGGGFVYYFDLRFYDGGFFLMRLIELGVRLRCALFKNPFGDQALCLPRDAFAALGGYDETAAYGEDHALVIKARKRGVALRRLPAAVKTSARKYQKHGWLRTVLRHQYLWIKQYLAAIK